MSEAVSDEAVMDRLEILLTKQRKLVSLRTDSRIEFDHPIWAGMFSPNWLALSIFDFGSFVIEHESKGRRLRYDLRCLHLFLAALIAALIAASVTAMTIWGSSLRDGLNPVLYSAVLVFAWFYGGNLGFALTRVEATVDRVVN